MVDSPVGCCFSLDGTKKLCWMIHTGCNLRCDHCAVFDNAFVASHNPVRTHDDIERVLQFIRTEGIEKVVVSGGEPTLSRWCCEVIGRLTAEGVQVSMSTNATTLTAHRVQKLGVAGLQKATVSLDGATSARHDAVRGEGNFDRAMAGTRRLVDAGIDVSVGTFLRADTIDELAALGYRCQELGVRRLSLFFPVLRGRFSTGSAESASATPAELFRTLRPQRLSGLRVTVHQPRCEEHDCPSGEVIFGAIGGQAFRHCVYKHQAAPRLALDMLAA